LDGKLVSGSLSAPEGSEPKNSLPSFTYTQKFKELFPYYLALGMSPDEYWRGDPELARDYRKAEEIRNEKRNQELWLQGMYFYEALCDASPIFHDFAKKGTKPAPYPSHPYSLTAKQIEEEKVENERKVSEKGKKLMEALMAATNAKFKEKTQE